MMMHCMQTIPSFFAYTQIACINPCIQTNYMHPNLQVDETKILCLFHFFNLFIWCFATVTQNGLAVILFLKWTQNGRESPTNPKGTCFFERNKHAAHDIPLRASNCTD